MKQKLNSQAGLTLVEMLASTAILMLLALMLNTGLQMMFRTYQTMIAKSEVELLLSTAVDALADDLRYAWYVKDYRDPEDPVPFQYSSDSFGAKTHLELNGGQITAKSDEKPEGWLVLPTGAYGSTTSYKEYKVTDLRITYRTDPTTKEITFTVYLTVATEDGSIRAGTPIAEDGTELGVTVRCLNPAAP